MKLSLQTKVTTFVTLMIVIISVISTYLFASAQSRGIERELIARGMALSYSLSKAAEEGLIKEDLDLIKKAAYLIRAEDVILVQAFSTLWDGIDAYPFERLSAPPHPDAVRHFEKNSGPLHIRTGAGYDFYRPILFSPLEDSTYTIGFVRISLSSAHMQNEIRKSIFTSIFVSGTLTLFAIFAVNILIHRLVVRPVGTLRDSLAKFKNGLLSGEVRPPSRDEIGELFLEFNRMTSTIREKENSLIESGKRINNLFERVEHAIFRLDREGNIVESNRRFNELFGTVKKLCMIFFMGEKTVPDCIRRASFEQVLHIEQKAFNREGDELIVLLSLYPDYDQNGALTGFDGYILDITEKKRLEDTLLHTQKMEAIGTLAGGIAHDFNNMLQGILGYTSLMMMNLREDDPHYKPVGVIEHSALRAAELTKQLLGFARGGKYITKPVDLNRAVTNVVRIISRTFDKTIEIKISPANDLRAVEADQSQIEHSILNLCLNAKDAMPSGGILSLETLNFSGKPPSPGAAPGEYAVIRVSDTGTGMDKEVMKRMFEPFFTTKEKSEGTGMGLAMVYGVIKNHDGFITVDSEPGTGSTFTVYLPATGRRVETEEAVREEMPSGRGTILVVDDEDTVRNLAATVLSRCGYEVITASDGQEAVELYRRRKDEISAVILDIIMPKMGGREVYDQMREINPDVRVLVSSGYSINGTAKEILDAGAQGFIQKPFNANTLAGKIKEVLGE